VAWAADSLSVEWRVEEGGFQPIFWAEFHKKFHKGNALDMPLDMAFRGQFADLEGINGWWAVLGSNQ
jgi:hypothetical protein